MLVYWPEKAEKVLMLQEIQDLLSTDENACGQRAPALILRDRAGKVKSSCQRKEHGIRIRTTQGNCSTCHWGFLQKLESFERFPWVRIRRFRRGILWDHWDIKLFLWRGNSLAAPPSPAIPDGEQGPRSLLLPVCSCAVLLAGTQQFPGSGSWECFEQEQCCWYRV